MAQANSGAMSYTPIALSGGLNSVMASTLPSNWSPSAAAANGTTQSPTGAPVTTASQFFGEPLGVWMGFVILLLLLKWLTENPALRSKYNPAYIKISGYNVMAIGLSAGIFFILLKVIFTRYNVPGLTQFSQAL